MDNVVERPTLRTREPDKSRRVASCFRATAWLLVVGSAIVLTPWFSGRLGWPADRAVTLGLPVAAAACAIVALIVTPTAVPRRGAIAALACAALLVAFENQNVFG